jgi:hypothetical protein
VGRWLRGPHEWLCSDRADATAATVGRVCPLTARHPALEKVTVKRPHAREDCGERPPCWRRQAAGEQRGGTELVLRSDGTDAGPSAFPIQE